MKCGISTACFYPCDTEKALERIVEREAPCVEIFPNAFTEMTRDFGRNFKSILKGSNTVLTSVHPFTSYMETSLFFDSYERRFNDGIELYKRTADFIADLGAKFMVFHGAVKQCPVDMDTYVERFYRVREVVKSFGVELAQENVGRCHSSNPQLFIKLKEAIPDAAFVLDLKQALRSGTTALNMAEAMGKNLAHLHLSDSSSKNDCLAIPKGDFDFKKFFTHPILKDYNGNAVVELYRESYESEEEIFESMDYINRVYSEIYGEVNNI